MAARDDPLRLILASGSAARRRMLEAAGLEFSVVPADVDEAAIRQALRTDDAELDPCDIAEVLARAKAEEVSRRHPGALVIGADQVLALGTEILEKSKSAGEAHACLMKLRGHKHQLHSAVALAEGGEVTWTCADTAHLTMRSFSPQFLADYLARAGNAILDSVGAYHIEGPGVQLFEQVDGDYFTILGLPLLPLLAELRLRKAVTA